ncbi:MAG: PIN domain-containing protein [Candidatus Woesearchaeota archaeon]
MARYYFDTSIWVDLYENRKGFCSEPLGDYAFKLLSIITARGDSVIITDLLIRELEKNYSIPEIKGMFKLFEDITIKIMATQEERKEAENVAVQRSVPLGDALHAIIARDNNLILVTRDNHFRHLKDISEHYKPEELT